jgi:hypothetical protein
MFELAENSIDKDLENVVDTFLKGLRDDGINAL